ncbi:uncharacterized protein LOC124076395 isoform X2 [Marmota monax]|uniref:uncharacterized protein LOC124076395 isoform X2 n=1 Tax=Marmota monax TaxID=9995 RepID=UPI001EB01C20|nr:uncharacterized protein LOC124076395 isoform X2 [Marmota monax]
MQKSRPFRRPRRQSSPYGCTAPSPDPIHWTPKRRNFWKQLRSCFMCCCLCLADGPPPIGTPESGRSSFRSTPDSPGEVHPGENITAYSLGDLEETLEPAFFYDCFSSASNISSSSTQQEMGQMLGSQVTVTGPEEEDQGHQVPALTENPEPMEEQAEALVLVEAPVRGPTSPPSDRELELDALALDHQGQRILLALQSALHLERNPEPLVLSQAICLFIFIVCVYYFI